MLNISTHAYYTERVYDKCFEKAFEKFLENKFRKISLENKCTKTGFEKLIYKRILIITCISVPM